MSTKAKPSTLRRKVFSPRNSRCNTSSLADLYEFDWFQDTGGLLSKDTYLHVLSTDLETRHRVHPKPIPGYRCNRIACKDGFAYWLYDLKK